METRRTKKSCKARERGENIEETQDCGLCFRCVLSFLLVCVCVLMAGRSAVQNVFTGRGKKSEKPVRLCAVSIPFALPRACNESRNRVALFVFVFACM